MWRSLTVYLVILCYLSVPLAAQRRPKPVCDFDLPQIEEVLPYMSKYCQRVYRDAEARHYHQQEAEVFDKFNKYLLGYELRNLKNKDAHDQSEQYPFDRQTRRKVYDDADFAARGREPLKAWSDSMVDTRWWMLRQSVPLSNYVDRQFARGRRSVRGGGGAAAGSRSAKRSARRHFFEGK